jgi:hypothetical protein
MKNRKGIQQEKTSFIVWGYTIGDIRTVDVHFDVEGKIEIVPRTRKIMTNWGVATISRMTQGAFEIQRSAEIRGKLFVLIANQLVFMNIFPIARIKIYYLNPNTCLQNNDHCGLVHVCMDCTVSEDSAKSCSFWSVHYQLVIVDTNENRIHSFDNDGNWEIRSFRAQQALSERVFFFRYI